MTRSYLLSLIAGSMVFLGVATTPVQAQQNDLNSLILNGVMSALLNQGLGQGGNQNLRAPQNAPLDQLGLLGSLLGAQTQSGQRAPNVNLNPTNLRPRENTRNILPGGCMQQVRTSAGTVRVFGQPCLEQHYRHTASLPRDCAVRVNNSRDLRNAFDAYCLQQAGYRVSGR